MNNYFNSDIESLDTVICPYCGHHQDDCKMYFYAEDESIHFYCEQCYREFILYMIVFNDTIFYETKTLELENKNE